MRHDQGPSNSGHVTKLVRLDQAHQGPSLHGPRPALNPRRVRQVLSGAMRPERTAESAVGTPIRMFGSAPEADRPAPCDQVLRRFRDSFYTLSHIASDPIVWDAEEGAILTDLREALLLTESALLRIEAEALEPRPDRGSASGVVALARVIDRRVDELFGRMERLTGLRQQVFRLAEILDGVIRGRPPGREEIEALVPVILAAAQGSGPVTLVKPGTQSHEVWIASHAVNVATVCARLAADDAAWHSEQPLAVTAALMQDAGMMRVPQEILARTEALSAPQRTLIQQHTAVSASLVGQVRGLDERLVAAVYQHHERLDGSGYPDQAASSSISSVARLLAVADTYVGMQSSRPYRAPLSATQTISEIERAAVEGRLDPAWTRRLPTEPPRWLALPDSPQPPSDAAAVSARAA